MSKQDKPIQGEEYYFADYITLDGFYVNKFSWTDTSFDNDLYTRGLICSSREKAIALVFALNNAIGKVLR